MQRCRVRGQIIHMMAESMRSFMWPGRHVRVLVPNHLSHRPVRHHLRAAQGETRERVLGPVALKVRQDSAPLVRVPRFNHHHRVAEHDSRDGAQEHLGLGVEICEICVGGVGHVAPCARGTPGSHTLGRVSGYRLRRGGRLAPLGGRHRTNVRSCPWLRALQHCGIQCRRVSICI